MLTVCGEEIEHDNPLEPFYAGNLDKELFDRKEAICLEAGVKEGPLLKAWFLDVAVICDIEAAKVFDDMLPPSL